MHKPISAYELGNRFGLSHVTARQLMAVNSTLGSDETRRRMTEGASVNALFMEITGQADIPPWVKNAFAMQRSVQHAQRKGEWTEDDAEAAGMVASWLDAQGSEES